MNLAQKTTKGIFWSSFSIITVTLLNFAIITILARLLMPSDFGTFVTVMLVINFAIILSDLGIGAGIIQKKDIKNEELSSLFFLNIGFGVMFFILIFYSSPLFAKFFKNNQITSLLKLISISFIFIGIGQIQRILLQKWMKFNYLAIVEICGIIIYGATSISFAYIGLGVKSIIIGFLARQICETILLWSIKIFTPQLIFKLQNIKSIINFGGYVVAERTLNYFNRDLAQILIGKFLGSQPLGYYSLAHQLMLFPVSRMAAVISKVMFPAFSNIQENNEKIREGYLKTTKYISLITFPLMAGLFAVAREFILSVYGTKWQPVVPVLQIFCAVGAVHSIGTTVGTVLYAKGRPDISFKWNIFAICCVTTSIVIGIRWGIVGIAFGWLIITIPTFFILQYITNRLIELKMKTFILQLKNQAIGAMLVICGIFILKKVICSFTYIDIRPIFILIPAIIFGIFIYFIVIVLKEKQLWGEMKSLIKLIR